MLYNRAEPKILSGATSQCSAFHQEVVSSNPSDATATCGWELRNAKFACALREEGVVYSLPTAI